MSYEIVFEGELKDDEFIRRKFVTQYNKACDVVNAKISEWNDAFDEVWDGEPILDYSTNESYQKWMLYHHRVALANAGLHKDLFLIYEYDENLQFYAVGRFGRIKDKKISFVLRRG